MIDARFDCSIWAGYGDTKFLVCKRIRIFTVTSGELNSVLSVHYCHKMFCRKPFERKRIAVEFSGASGKVHYTHIECFVGAIPEAQATFVKALDLAPEIKAAVILELAG